MPEKGHNVAKSSAERDLKSQLENIQRRINTETEEALTNRNSKKSTPFSNILSKRDKRTSVPLFAGSDAHNGVLSSGSSKDVNFVVGLSENLLLECRRLQAENEVKSVKLKALHEEYVTLQEKLSEVTAKHRNACKEENSLKDVNWELEVKLQKVMKDLKDLTESYHKTQQELKKQKELCDTFKTELEEVALKRIGLKEELDSKQRQYTSEVADLKAHVQELNEENEQLHLKLGELKSRVEELASEVERNRSNNENNLTGTEVSSEENRDINTRTKAPHLTEGETSISDMKDLESQTMKVNFERANQTISKLRQQIIRLKTERAADSPRVKRTSQRSTPASRKGSRIPQGSSLDVRELSTPSKLNTQFNYKTRARGVVDSPSENDDWEKTSLQDTGSHSLGFSEHFAKTEDDSDFDTKSDVSETMDMVRNPLFNDLIDTDNEEEIESLPSYANVKGFAEAHNLVLLPSEEYENLINSKSNYIDSQEEIVRSGKELNIFALPNDNSVEKKSQVQSQNEKISELEAIGYHVIPDAEFSQMKQKETTLETTLETLPVTYLETKARSLGLKLIANDEYEELLQPSIPKIIEKLHNSGYETLTKASYDDLLSQVDQPALEYLDLKLSECGKVAISMEDYERLKSPNVEELSLKAESLGHALVEKEVLASLHSMMEKPTIEFLSKKALDIKHQLISQDSLRQLTNPSAEKISEFALNTGKVTVSKQEYECFVNPSIEYLQNKAAPLNHILLPKITHEKLLNPSTEDIKKRAALLGFTLIGNDEFDSLCNPTLSQLQMKAYKIDHEVVPLADYQSALDAMKTLKSPDINYLATKADESGHKVVDKNSYAKLVEQITNPTEELARLYAKNSHSVLVEEDHYKDLFDNFTTPSVQFLKEKATILGFAVVEQHEYDELLATVENPTTEFIKTMCEAQGKAVIGTVELSKLKEQIEDPNEEYIRKHATAKDFELINKNELAEVKHQISTPSIEYLSLKANGLGYKLVDTAEYNVLLDSLENPSVEVLKAKAQKYSYALISEEELRKSKKCYDNPDLEYLKEKAVGHQIIPQDMYKKFLDLQDCPSLDFLIEKSNMKGYDILSKSEHEDMLRRIYTPTIEEMRTMALKFGNVVVPEEAHVELQKALAEPTKTYIQRMAPTQDLIAVDKAEYDDLQRATKQEFILDSVKSFGFMALSCEDFSTLKRSDINTVGIAELEDRLKTLGYHAISLEDFGEINKPITERADKSTTILLCEKHGLKPISAEEYEDLKRDANSVISEDELIKLTEAHGNAVVPLPLFEEMKQTIDVPSVDYLQQHAARLSKVLVEENLYKENMDMINSPSLQFITDRASMLGYKVIEMNQYQKLYDSFESPSKTFIEEKAKNLDLSAVPSKELAKLRTEIDQPSLAYLTSKARDLGKTVIDVLEIDELLRKDEYPTQEELQSRASKLNMHIVPIDEYHNMAKNLKEPSLDFIQSAAKTNKLKVLNYAEYDELIKSLENPSFDEISKNASKVSAVVIPEAEYNKTKEANENPTEESLADMASRQNKVIVVRELYDEMKAQVEMLKKPNFELLTSLGAQLKYSLMPTKELEELKAMSANPTESFLNEKANSIGKILIDKEEHESLLSSINSPDFDYLKEKSQSMSMILMESSDYEILLKKLQQPTLSFLEEKAAEHSRALVERATLEEYENAIHEPSLEYLTTSAAKLGKVVVDKNVWKELKETEENPKESFLIYHASRSNKIMVSSDYIDGLKKSAENPDFDTLKVAASQLEMSILPNLELQSLQNALEAPSLELLREHLEKINHVCLSKQDFEALVEKAEKPNLQDVKNAAKKHDYELLSLIELDTLKNPALSKLETDIKSHGQVVMDADTYATLLNSSKDKISKEEVIGLCKTFSLTPVPLDQYEKLISLPTPEKVRKDANDIGFVAISREDYDRLKVQAELPDLETIERSSNSFGLKILKLKEYESIMQMGSEPSESDLERIAKKRGLMVIPIEKYNHILEEIQSKTRSEEGSVTTSKVLANKEYFEKVIREENSPRKREKVLESAKSLGFITLSSDEYKALLENQKENSLTKTDIYNAAKKFELTILPTDEYKSLLKRKNSHNDISYSELESFASRFNVKLIPINSDFEAQYTTNIRLPNNSQANSQSDSQSVSSSIVSSENEAEFFDALQSVDSLSFPPLHSSSTSDTNSTEYRDAFDDNLSQVDDAVSQVSTVREGSISETFTFEYLQKRANELGYTLVAITGTKVNAPPALYAQHNDDNKDIEEEAPGLADAAEDNSDGENFSDTWNEEELKIRAAKISMVVITEKQYKQYENMASKKIGRNELEERARELDLVVIPNTMLGELKKNEDQKVHKDLKQSREEVASNDITYSKESILREAPHFDLHVLPREEFIEMKKLLDSTTLTEKVLRAKASGFGLVVLNKNEINELRGEKFAHGDIVENRHVDPSKCQVNKVSANVSTVESGNDPAGQSSRSDTTILSSQRSILSMKPEPSNALTAIVYQENASVLQPLSKEQVEESALPSGQTIVSKEYYEHLLKIEENSTKMTLSKDELIEKAHEYGLVPLESEQFEQIKEELAVGAHDLTLEDIMMKSAEFGVVPIQKDQFDQIKKELANPTLTEDQIVQHANDFGLVAIKLTDFETLKKESQARTKISIAGNDEDEPSGEEGFEFDEKRSETQQLNRLSKKLGMMCIPESSFMPTSAASTPDTNNVVVLPVSYYHGLLAKEQETFDNITNDELQVEAKKRGLHIGFSKKDYVSSSGKAPTAFLGSRISRQSSNRSLASTESNARKSLAEAAASAAYNEFELQHQMAKSQGHSRSSSMNRTIAYSVDADVTHVRRSSFDAGISLATMASLSEPSIIPALTQTVIGEYLYKYYRRLGPISNLSSRHERYFWIHPYTMTLYWSSSNPVLESPAHNRTRAAAILDVDSVDDPNPYPAGLYHKSIIVKTDARSVKFTCCTRQRHNIWFNSLRYLVQRNMNGINLDEDGAADPPEANKIYQLPGESVRHTNQRLSSTRRLTSSSKMKQRSTYTRSPRI